MSSPPTYCIPCQEYVPALELPAHLREHVDNVADLEETLRSIRELALAGIGNAAAVVTRGRDALETAVAEARAAGASWTEVGKAAGISRQAAREKWSR